MGALFTMCFAWVARFFGMSAVTWWARWMAIFLIGALLLQFYNFLVDTIKELLELAHTLQTQAASDSNVNSVLSSYSAIQLVSIGGYLAHHLRLIESFAVIINFITLKTLLRFFPLRWMFG